MEMEKRLRRKILIHMLYGFGAAIVIIGALFKILHIEIGPLTGGLVLGIGLGTEALIFCVAALDTSDIKEEHESFVESKGKSSSPEQTLSEKLDDMLMEANLDIAKMEKLSGSIDNFQHTVQALNPISDVMTTTTNYSDKLTEATAHLEELNDAMRKQAGIVNEQTEVQSDRLEMAKSNTELDEQTFEKAENLKAQINELSQNLEALNQVYAGMLSAMNKN